MESELFGMPMWQYLLVGIAAAFVSGFVAASHAYAKDRKNVPPTSDLIDGILLGISSMFSGFVGFLAATYKLEDIWLIIAITCLCGVGGYDLLMWGIESVKKKVLSSVQKDVDNNGQ